MTIRIIFIFVAVLLIFFLYNRIDIFERNSEKPVFLITDEIIKQHDTNVEVFIRSYYKPDSLQLKKLVEDYKNIWAHLNHLYQTNDIIAGKEFYTEKWFRQLNTNYNYTINSGIKRNDLTHNFIIKNWSSDGLVCTAIDSNIVLAYDKQNSIKDTLISNIGIVLLLQGDNWRIDAMRVIE